MMIEGWSNKLEFLGVYESTDKVPAEKVKLGTIALIGHPGEEYKEFVCTGFDSATGNPVWAELMIAPIGRPDVLEFIKGFKKSASDRAIIPSDKYIANMYEDAIETVFYNGYCYWFARILKERFDGKIVYSQIDNHFACLIEDYYYDIKGCLGSVYDLGIFVDWEEYKKLDVSDAQRVYRDCILKLGDGPIDKENNTCMGVELKVYNEEEELKV